MNWTEPNSQFIRWYSPCKAFQFISVALYTLKTQVNWTGILYMPLDQGSDTWVHTQKNPVGFLHTPT